MHLLKRTKDGVEKYKYGSWREGKPGKQNLGFTPWDSLPVKLKSQWNYKKKKLKIKAYRKSV